MGQFVGQIFWNSETTELSCGWSEVYWMQGTDYNTCMTQLVAILAAERPIRPAQVTAVYLRVSDITLRGDAYSQVISEAGTWANTAHAAQPTIALLIQMTSATFFSRYRYWHGIPDDQFNLGLWEPTGPWSTAFAAYRTALMNNTFMKLRNPPITGPETYIPIANLIPQKAVSHRVGRPFGAPRGRRLIA